LTLSEMATVAAELNKKNNYDVILVRGYEIAKTLLNSPHALSKSWIYLTDIAQSIVEYSDDERDEMRRIAEGSARILCQTEGFRKLWLALVPQLPTQKCELYTPVVPNFKGKLLPIS